MEFESRYIEKKLDYFGENGFIDGEGFRRKKEVGEETENKIMIIKGVDEMINKYDSLQESIEAYIEEPVEKEYFEIEKALTEATKKILLEAMNTLNKFKLEISKNKELREAILSLAKYVGYGYPGTPSKYPYPVKKQEAVDWLSVQEMFFGKLEKSDEKEISKSDITDSDPFPSLSKQFKENDELIDEVIEENNLGERLV